jgi:hypothetical protein
MAAGRHRRPSTVRLPVSGERTLSKRAMAANGKHDVPV